MFRFLAICLMCALFAENAIHGKISPSIAHYKSMDVQDEKNSIQGHRPMTVKNCGIRKPGMSMLVGGEEAQHGDYPWMVSIQKYLNPMQSVHHCGGTIINEHWIVTAAHCVPNPDDPWEYVIFTGMHKLTDATHMSTTRHQISKIIVHEDYNKVTDENDIALLRTLFSMDFSHSNGFVNGICLPQTDEDPTGQASIAGWGSEVAQGRISEVLQTVEVPIVPRDMCNEAYFMRDISDAMICAGSATGDSCTADSGGPLMQKNKYGVYTLVGVVSFGMESCGHKIFPGVNTKVAAYMEWMEQNMYN